MKDLIRAIGRTKYQNIGIAPDIHKRAADHAALNLTILGRWVERAIENQIAIDNDPKYKKKCAIGNIGGAI